MERLNLTLQNISNKTPPLLTPTQQQQQKHTNQPRHISLKHNTTNKHTTDSYLLHLCNTGHLQDAVASLTASTRNKISPTTLTLLLQSCIDADSVALGRKVHSFIDRFDVRHPFVDTKLVGMYAKSGCFGDARKVFDGMRERNLYTWSAMIGACSREQRWREVVELFYMMVGNDGFFPDGFLVPKILQACGNFGDFRTGELIHSLVVKLGLGYFPRVNNSLLAVYAKCGKLASAHKFFNCMDERDIVAWNALIFGYCLNGHIEEGRRLFNLMREEGVEPSLVTWNIMISGYNQIGNCDMSMGLMKEMQSLGINPDVVAWTTMISGFAQNDRENQALELFKEMILTGVKPNGVTISSAISACASLKALGKGLEIHSLAIRMGCSIDVLVGNSLIDMYSKCKDLEAARSVFDMMLERDMYTWNSMIAGYCQAGFCGKAYVLFMKMQNSEIRPNVVTWNTMISGYIENGDEDQAMDLFHRMETEGKIKRDTASWNSLIAGYMRIGQRDRALGIFKQMQAFAVPNHVTLLSLLPSCANLVAMKKVKEIHCCILRRNLDHALSVTNSLMDTYAKSGNLHYSRTIFDRMLSKDYITFNSLITGYVLHGCHYEALAVVDRMEESGFKPNRGTLVNIILAHGLAGLVDEGKRVFSKIIEDYNIIPASENYAAMVDLYGRAGMLKEAMEVIENMPIRPDASVWSTLLTACRVHGNYDMAVHAAERLVNLDPDNALVHHSILQRACCFSKELEEVERLKRLEKDHKMTNIVGRSLIEVKNTICSFLSGDMSQSNSDHLLSWIESLSREFMACDHDPGSVLEEEEREEVVGVHSEKLALAFAFVSSSYSPKTIRIVKDLRMCRACHDMVKHVSLNYGCEILLSDSKCLHHFKSGSCSCGDYW